MIVRSLWFLALIPLLGACRVSNSPTSIPTERRSNPTQAALQKTVPPKISQTPKVTPTKMPPMQREERPIPPKPAKRTYVDRWYLPTYRERRFYPPRVKIKKLPPIQPIAPTTIQHGPRHKKWVALTFDACSWNSKPRFDREVANILIRTKTPATLFMGGRWVLARQKDARWLASFPFFEIANHSYLHGHLTKVSKKRLQYELQWTQEIIYTYLNRIPTLFRPPFIEFDKRLVKVAATLGMKNIIGLSSGDPDPSFTKAVLVRYMKKAIKPGSIVIMHINRGGKHTAEALPDIIQWLKRSGYQFVTVGTMLASQRK